MGKECSQNTGGTKPRKPPSTSATLMIISSMRKQFKTFFESDNLVKVDFDEKLHPYCKNQTPAAIMRGRDRTGHTGSTAFVFPVPRGVYLLL